jgi:uncharacterized protein (TIGR03437 family)
VTALVRISPLSLFLFAFAFAVVPIPAQTTLNLSHDLVPLGVASQNLAPNMPGLDAQPLVTAAIQYAQNNNIPVLVADPGAYYFLTPTGPVQYVFLGNVSDLTIDFQGSNLYFQDGMLRAFEVDYCRNVTLKNFTIDQLVPRYTQVQLTSFDPVQQTLTYSVLPGWADPATFTATDFFGTPQLLAAFFRNGAVVPFTAGLALINYPIASPTLSVNPNGDPTTEAAILGRLQAGDLIAVWDRNAAEAISVYSCDSVTLSNIEVHGSGGVAVAVTFSSNSTADNVRVKPRPGGLIGSNADGIHFGFSLRNNHIRNCYVSGSTDDALGLDSDFLASVVSQPGARQLVMARNFAYRFVNGTMVNFVHLGDASEVTGAVVVSQDPPDSPDVSGGGQITVTFDRDLPPLSAGDEMVFASADMRGDGSTIEDSTVENIPYGRGIFLEGIENVVVQRNVIRATSNAGINVHELMVPAGGGGVPAHGVTIQNNSVEDSMGPEASSLGVAVVNRAGILVQANDQNYNFLLNTAHSNISILNNYVADSGRGGIWVGELNGGDVNNNVVVRWDAYPESPVTGGDPYAQDFAQPFVARFSQNIASAGNIFQAQSTLTGAVSLNPSSVSPDNGPFSSAFSVTPNVPDFSWAAASDSPWLVVTAGASGTGNGTVQYSVAQSTGGSPRTGKITVAGVVFTVTQGVVQGAPTFSAAAVASAASYANAAVSPGEIVVIFGANLGPATLAGAQLDPDGLVSTQVANTQVLCDGVAAPIVYASATATSVILPYSISGGGTQIVVRHNGLNSAPVTVPVAPSVPGLFTSNAGGAGQGAISNQDGSLNSAQNPAARGSVITLYATGEGMTSPPGVDGKIAVPPYPAPVLPVSVTIDGVPATIQYKGGAPGEVAGVMQVNVSIPASVHSGNVPVSLTVGNATSQDLVTVAVR